MYVRYVHGRAYLAECVRIGGRVIQRHPGRADSNSITLVRLLAAERDEERQDQRQRRDEVQERDRELAEHWTRVRQEFESNMRQAGFHNPNGRGWRRRRVGQSAR